MAIQIRGRSSSPARKQCRLPRCNKAHLETEGFGRRKFDHRRLRNMIGEVIVIGDLQLRDGSSVDEHDRLGERMYDIVSRLPGFVSIKSFKADDGEELT